MPKETFSNATKMRSEAQAPFRVARMFLFGAFGANATLGFGIAPLQAVTKALGAPNGAPLDQSLQNLGINLGCALFFGYLYKRDADGRDKQMARISREERLSNLKCELAGGKVVSLHDLRAILARRRRRRRRGVLRGGHRGGERRARPARRAGRVARARDRRGRRVARDA